MVKAYVYKGGFSLVKKSGIGSALIHQEEMLKRAGIPMVENWKEASVVHINTIFPDSLAAACLARKQGKFVIYYAHSTMEDFKNSFIGSNRMASFFKKWICFCYAKGDIILTPTRYSRQLLKSYGIKKKIYALTNGVDCSYFRKDPDIGTKFRWRYHIPTEKKVVISVGHWIERKGILDFFALAEKMPDTVFVWFGGGAMIYIPKKIRWAIRNKPENVILAGHVEPWQLKEAYCGADAFAFCSSEETEGIVVLEALACEIPVIVRDIPVYDGWLTHGKQVWKASNIREFQMYLRKIFQAGPSEMQKEGRRTAEERDLEAVGRRMTQIYQTQSGRSARSRESDSGKKAVAKGGKLRYDK